jgi:phosphoglycolate phosphatase-like HAD superfamily hydrolase
MDPQKILKELKPLHDYFIGIDSDGCVFDSMEVKQKEFFIPNALKHFNLYAISDILTRNWEFVNLYSINRGGNRFTSLIKVFELLAVNSDVIKSGVKLPDLSPLKEWIKTETKLGNATLRKYFESHYDSDLEKVLIWSESINDEIGRLLKKIPPFPHALQSIKQCYSMADLVIVSQTPYEALEREWRENDLIKFVRTIAGQEQGTKAEHLALSAIGKYHDDRILMIGDAKGDLDAAKKNGILFYPVIPGSEDYSWERFLNEGLDRFMKGNYSDGYEKTLITEFLKALPEKQQ